MIWDTATSVVTVANLPQRQTSIGWQRKASDSLNIIAPRRYVHRHAQASPPACFQPFGISPATCKRVRAIANVSKRIFSTRQRLPSLEPCGPPDMPPVILENGTWAADEM